MALKVQHSLVVGLALASGACAPTVSGGNEAGGIVTHVIGLNSDAAFRAADAHCHKFGKIARVSATNALNNTMTFDCVTDK